MQIILGEKIKELRKRDGRKQEDLATALGVTNQAISRWESNKGYPDMEMIPAIANYFHVTIDELFGYDNDRNIKNQHRNLSKTGVIFKDLLSSFPIAIPGISNTPNHYLKQRNTPF